MNALPPSPSTLTLAKESLAMSEKTGDKNFRWMAIGMMALTGLATLFHAGHVIWRDLTASKRERQNGGADHDQPPPRHAEPEEEPSRHRRDDSPHGSWVDKARVSERPANGEKAWTDQRRRQNQPRQH
jgi:hypothetical protein